MNRTARWCAVALLMLAAVLGVRHAFREERNAVGAGAGGTPPPATTRRADPDGAASRGRMEASAVVLIDREWSDLLAWLDGDPTPSAEEIRERLMETRSRWLEADFIVLSKAVGRALDSGEDRATGLPFEVGRHGMLNSWPTLRVFLLDVLARSDPEMAAEIARRVLDTTGSADEYAVALRSLTREGLGRASDGELLTRFERMLGEDAWDGSPGFAEAFDLARFLGSPEAAESLAAWDGNSALRSMALHEFAAEHPGAVLPVLDGLDPSDRGSLIARADPVDPEQAAAVETFLKNPSSTPEEIEVFLKTFPLRSATTGYRLYGRTPAPFRREEMREGDREAREMVARWLADPSLERYHEPLGELRERLDDWLEEDD